MKEEDEKNFQSRSGIIWWQPALILFGRFSGWIIGPILLATISGKWLDKKFDSEPWFFLSAVGLAFVISITGLIKNVLEEYKKIEKNNKKSQKK